MTQVLKLCVNGSKAVTSDPIHQGGGGGVSAHAHSDLGTTQGGCGRNTIDFLAHVSRRC